MTEQWVEESDWSKVKVGQRVRLEHDNGNIAECTVNHSDVRFLDSETTRYWVGDGWTLYVTSPPTPQLPTEDGFYTVSPYAHPYERLLVLRGGAWFELNSDDYYEPAKLAALNIRGLTRLAPVPDTARQVLDRIDAVSIMVTGGRRMISLAAWDSLAAEFGVVAERGTE